MRQLLREAFLRIRGPFPDMYDKLFQPHRNSGNLRKKKQGIHLELEQIESPH